MADQVLCLVDRLWKRPCGNVNQGQVESYVVGIRVPTLDRFKVWNGALDKPELHERKAQRKLGLWLDLVQGHAIEDVEGLLLLVNLKIAHCQVRSGVWIPKDKIAGIHERVSRLLILVSPVGDFANIQIDDRILRRLLPRSEQVLLGGIVLFLVELVDAQILQRWNKTWTHKENLSEVFVRLFNVSLADECKARQVQLFGVVWILLQKLLHKCQTLVPLMVPHHDLGRCVVAGLAGDGRRCGKKNRNEHCDWKAFSQ